MSGLLTAILRPRRRRPEAPPAARSPEAATRSRARRLARAVDRATAAGRWDRAARLAAAAEELAARHPRLAESVARLRLARGDAEAALSVIERCRGRPASLRLLRAACLLIVGAAAEAQLDLHRWSDRSSAPLDARLLLALLERGRDPARAVAALRRNLRHLGDAASLQALLLISVLRGRDDQTQHWAERLRTCCGTGGMPQSAEADLVLRSLGLPGLGRDAAPAPEETGALAMELIACEAAIGPLVEAQRLRPHRPTARLLAGAIERALPELDDPAAARRALATLALILREYAGPGPPPGPASPPAVVAREVAIAAPPPDGSALREPAA